MIQPAELASAEPLYWSPGKGTDLWELLNAAQQGDLETIKRLVAHDSSLVRAQHEYRTALSFAVRANQLAVAEWLLDHGSTLAFGDMVELARERELTEMAQLIERKVAALYGGSERGEPVAAAIRDRKPKQVLALLDADPTLLHAGDRRSNQPIHWAVMTRQLDLIDELLERGADINAKRGDGARPIQLSNGDYDYRGWRDVPKYVLTTPDRVYRHLVERGAYVDICMAAAKGDLARVRALLDADPGLVNRVDEYNSYYEGCGAPIKNAVLGGHLEVVKLLLDRGADPGLTEEHIAPRGHALYAAVAGRNQEMAKLLLEHGADPNAAVESSADVVWRAIGTGDRVMLRLLASYGAVWEIPLDLNGKLSYEEVVATGIGLSVKVLARYGDVRRATPRFEADPSLADDPEALEAAAAKGDEAFVRLMLRHQPDVASRVMVARPKRMALLLFQHGMDPNRPRWVHRMPLHHFAEHGDLDGAELYLDHGADLHARDEETCSTPLALAARAGKLAMVEFLLRRGARTLPDDPPWATPLAWAMRRGHRDIVTRLTVLEPHA